jgi:hypothetical protein
MIYTHVVWPIAAALWGALAFIGAPSGTGVHLINDQQKAFFESFMQNKVALQAFMPKELRTWVSKSAEELNAILKKEEFGIQLEPFKPTEFGVVSILDIMLRWLHEGQRSSITVAHKDSEDTKLYDAFELKDGFAVERLEGYAHPVITIMTKNDDGTLAKDRVHLTVADEVLTGGQLWEKIVKIRSLERKEIEEYTHVVVPMVDYDQSFKLDWLLGLSVKGWYISQALQQTKFKMNEKGARIKSAVAIAMKRSMAPMPSNKLIIDKPFYLWIERDGLPYPVFTGYLNEQFWKDPKEL